MEPGRGLTGLRTGTPGFTPKDGPTTGKGEGEMSIPETRVPLHPFRNSSVPQSHSGLEPNLGLDKTGVPTDRFPPFTPVSDPQESVTPESTLRGR